MPHRSQDEATEAVAHLPGLNIEIRHRQSPGGLAEKISIQLRAVPSFEAFARSVEIFNPFGLWVEAMRLAWLPWMQAFGALMPPPRLGSLAGSRQGCPACAQQVEWNRPPTGSFSRSSLKRATAASVCSTSTATPVLARTSSVSGQT